MKELIGKKVNAVYVGNADEVLLFSTDDGPIAYETYGDCCSETWFADIIGVSALIGGVVRTVEDSVPENYNEDDGRGRQECEEVYGHKITTDKGYVDIVYRNSSNGYYGGSCHLMGVAPSPEGMVQITDDWKAE